MSLHTKDWLKLLGGAALLATGVGAAGIGPLAGLLGTAGTTGAGVGAAATGAGGALSAMTPAMAELSAAGAGAASTGAAAAGSAGGFGSLIAPSLIGQGTAMGASGAMGTPESKSTTYGQMPTLDTTSADPWAMFAQLMKQSKGGVR